MKCMQRNTHKAIFMLETESDILSFIVCFIAIFLETFLKSLYLGFRVFLTAIRTHSAELSRHLCPHIVLSLRATRPCDLGLEHFIVS